MKRATEPEVETQAEAGAVPSSSWRNRGVLYLSDMKIVKVFASKNKVPIITFEVG